jgi:DNA topoisomerase I
MKQEIKNKTKFIQQPSNRLDDTAELVVGGGGNSPLNTVAMNTSGPMSPAGLGVYTRIHKEMQNISIGNKNWKINVAEDITTGLSNSDSLEKNTGMLFVLPLEQKVVPINMSLMKYPLDIIFIGLDNKVKDILKNVKPREDAVYSGDRVKYFLEVNSNEADVRPGDFVRIYSNKIEKAEKIKLGNKFHEPKGNKSNLDSAFREIGINPNEKQRLKTKAKEILNKPLTEEEEHAAGVSDKPLKNWGEKTENIPQSGKHTQQKKGHKVVDIFIPKTEEENKRVFDYNMKRTPGGPNADKIYIPYGEEPPEGAQVQQGPKGGRYYIPQNVTNPKPGQYIEREQGQLKIKAMKFPEDLENFISDTYSSEYERRARITLNKMNTLFPDNTKVFVNTLNNYIKMSQGKLSTPELDDTIKQILNVWTDQWMHDRFAMSDFKPKQINDSYEKIKADDGGLWTGQRKLIHVRDSIDFAKKELHAAKYADDRATKAIAFDNLISTAHVFEAAILPSVLGLYPRSAPDNKSRFDDYSGVHIEDYQALGKLAKKIFEDLGYHRTLNKSFEIMHKSVMIRLMSDIIKQSFGTVASVGFTPTFGGSECEPGQEIDFFERKKKIRKEIDDIIEKSKVYVHSRSEAPQNAVLQQGKRGGLFYDDTLGVKLKPNEVVYESKKEGYKLRMLPLNATREAKRTMTTPGGVKIPPNWTSVFVAAEKDAPLQAKGLDSKNRKVFRYSIAHDENSLAQKHNRIAAFTKVYDNISHSIESDFSHDDSAAILYTISKTSFRIGSDNDTKAKVKAYGVSTLMYSNISVNGNKVKFDFTAKKGVHVVKEIIDEALAAKFRKTPKNLNQKVFKANDDDVRKYLKKISGDADFGPHDFRSYNANKIAINKMHSMRAPKTDKEFKKSIKIVATAVSEELFNTPVVALKNYIDSSIFSDWVFKLQQTGYNITINDVISKRKAKADNV